MTDRFATASFSWYGLLAGAIAPCCLMIAGLGLLALVATTFGAVTYCDFRRGDRRVALFNPAGVQVARPREYRAHQSDRIRF
ncbi:hypothetical protein [Burkholderia sp. JKS000303]|uniref:hypothetical protein n=1 Tax=Burkholderia sp. JKS000303 TaxID=1938747 RepID=UPI0015CF267F|nr:hypothetical protein [Burkholderia sp. JKS000303]